MGEDLIAFLIHGADGAVGFVVLEGDGKAVGIGDLDGIAGDIVDRAGDAAGGAAAEVGAAGAAVGGIIAVLCAVIGDGGNGEIVLQQAAVLVVGKAAGLADGVSAGLDAGRTISAGLGPAYIFPPGPCRAARQMGGGWWRAA